MTLQILTISNLTCSLLYVWYRDIDFNNYPIGRLNCSDSVVCFAFKFDAYHYTFVFIILIVNIRKSLKFEDTKGGNQKP